MPTYLLRHIDAALWAAVKRRADALGWPLKPLLLALLRDFASGKLTPEKR